ncbi:hypothetical protein [Mycolicibacterium arseniciresistens]|uniref:Uncharacterized protein n=1 Tax=Mycolicibacterium arseniciresistens TaxID=3062257 RepID=A0ABT8UH15_9MYCO|nr:hypothetical protein [Mycolicibacterium arseniciresistens]MDO3635474.1 hypothetical protein [Mycolicibacterium arseniciresistens]
MRTADLVPTPELVDQMVRDKPPGWAWAAFASVVFQRWAALEERKIAQVVGRAVHPAGRLRTGHDVAQFLTRHLRAADDVVAEAAAYLRAPEFAAVFGDGKDIADPDGVVRAAHHLADLYERMLEIAENCRRRSVARQHVELLDGCTRFVNQHLQDFGGLINDVLERHDEMQRQLPSGASHLEPIRLHTSTDEQLLGSILDQLHELG